MHMIGLITTWLGR